MLGLSIQIISLELLSVLPKYCSTAMKEYSNDYFVKQYTRY